MRRRVVAPDGGVAMKYAHSLRTRNGAWAGWRRQRSTTSSGPNRPRWPKIVLTPPSWRSGFQRYRRRFQS